MLLALFLPGCVVAAPAFVNVAAPLCQARQRPARVNIKYVIDGDTVKLNTGVSLRLIGIDTPEIGHEGRADQPGARAAGAYLKSLLDNGRAAAVVYGAQRHDHYGRLLGHLFLLDGSNVQALLLAGGYATPLIMPPNLGFLDCYQRAAAAAMAAHRGIWSYPDYQVIAAHELAPDTRGYRRVTGRVTGIGNSRSSVWVELGASLALRIVRSDLKYFTGTDLSRLVGETIRARGRVYRRNGQLRIRIRHPLDLQPGATE